MGVVCPAVCTSNNSPNGAHNFITGANGYDRCSYCACISSDDMPGIVSRKNRKSRKSRKSRKTRKSRKNRK
jgi:hypothetical protein